MTFRMDQVGFAYRERNRGAPREVFRALSVAIGDGECVAILGGEGCGKSTLLSLLDGLLAPERGTLLIDGRNPHAEPGHGRAARNRIGYAFQFPEEQFLHETVAREFEDALTARGVPDREVRDRMLSSLRFAGLDPEATPARSPFTLSAGESRRVVFALLHAARPVALLLDEPTAGLDAPGAACLTKLVAEVKREGGTIVVATHDVDFAAENADRVLMLGDGGVAAEGSADEMLTSGALLAGFGYELPETVALAERLRKEGKSIPGNALRRSALLPFITRRSP